MAIKLVNLKNIHLINLAQLSQYFLMEWGKKKT